MIEYTLVALTSIFFVVDPLGIIPTFLVMTERDTSAKRRSLAVHASLTATATLLAFAVLGGSILRAFGISLPAFRMAGGVVLFLVALDMMRALRTTQEGPDEVAEGTVKEDIAITPLAIPMLAGPAALSTVTMLMNQADSWIKVAVVLLTILVTGACSCGMLLIAEPIHRLFGRTGIHIVSRLMGLVLLAIAIQFILDGWQQFQAITRT
jgi:multiple antibiotic resistance protein